MQTQAIELATEEDFQRTLHLLMGLPSREAIQYDTFGDGEEQSFYIIVPGWLYEQLVPSLDAANIRYTRLDVKPISVLTPKEQAVLRGPDHRRG